MFTTLTISSALWVANLLTASPCLVTVSESSRTPVVVAPDAARPVFLADAPQGAAVPAFLSAPTPPRHPGLLATGRTMTLLGGITSAIGVAALVSSANDSDALSRGAGTMAGALILGNGLLATALGAGMWAAAD